MVWLIFADWLLNIFHSFRSFIQLPTNFFYLKIHSFMMLLLLLLKLMVLSSVLYLEEKWNVTATVIALYNIIYRLCIVLSVIFASSSVCPPRPFSPNVCLFGFLWFLRTTTWTHEHDIRMCQVTTTSCWLNSLQMRTFKKSLRTKTIILGPSIHTSIRLLCWILYNFFHELLLLDGFLVILFGNLEE